MLGSQFGQLFTLFQGLKETHYFQERGWTDWETFLYAHCCKVNVKTAFNHRKFFAMCLQCPNIALISVTTFSEFMRNHQAFETELLTTSWKATNLVRWAGHRLPPRAES